RRPAGARQRAVARAVRCDHGHARPGRAAAGRRQARGAATAGNGPPARRASSRGPSQGADARRDGDRLGRRRPLKALVLVVLLSAPGCLTRQPACGQGRAWTFGPFDKPTDAQRPYEWPGGVEDPRIVEAEDGSYVLTYTQWNRRIPRLAVATSRDLVHWTKHGPAFAQAYGGKYLGLESKSGAILARVEGSRVIATKVGGMYWMYFNVPDVLIATSDNLIAWTPLEDRNGTLLKVLSPRPGHFDSWLVEAGPPAL